MQSSLPDPFSLDSYINEVKNSKHPLFSTDTSKIRSRRIKKKKQFSHLVKISKINFLNQNYKDLLHLAKIGKIKKTEIEKLLKLSKYN